MPNGISLSTDMVSDVVNTIYRRKEIENPTDAILATDDAQKVLGSDGFSASQLTAKLTNASSRIVLSLNDYMDPQAAFEMAQDVAEKLDKSDGSQDGRIKVQGTSFAGESCRGVKGFIGNDDLAYLLAEGKVVIGEGSQLIHRADAVAHGDTILAIREVKSGPRIALGK